MGEPHLIAVSGGFEPRDRGAGPNKREDEGAAVLLDGDTAAVRRIEGSDAGQDVFVLRHGLCIAAPRSMSAALG
ncbi:MAG TPA: hypothetical protein VES64_04235 [Allosphingosinicella sp.]|nr:hypothetical protein [Allosphingosinicella sp.]